MPNDRLTIFAARPGMKVRCVDPWPPLKYMQTYTIAAGYNTSMALELREHPGRTFSTLRFIPASEPTLAALLAERDAATARAEAAEARSDEAHRALIVEVKRTEAFRAKNTDLTTQRDAATAERDRLAEALDRFLNDAEPCRDFGEWFEACCKKASAALDSINKEPTDGE